MFNENEDNLYLVRLVQLICAKEMLLKHSDTEVIKKINKIYDDWKERIQK